MSNYVLLKYSHGYFEIYEFAYWKKLKELLRRCWSLDCVMICLGDKCYRIIINLYAQQIISETVNLEWPNKLFFCSSAVMFILQMWEQIMHLAATKKLRKMKGIVTRRLYKTYYDKQTKIDI